MKAIRVGLLACCAGIFTFALPAAAQLSTPASSPDENIGGEIIVTAEKRPPDPGGSWTVR